MTIGICGPQCHHESEVRDSRPMIDGIRRRRRCTRCGHRFTTHEMLPPYEPDGKDSFRYARANEVRDLLLAMDHEDATAILRLAKRLAPPTVREGLAA